MSIPVVTVASGGLPVTELAAGKYGVPVSEATNKFGRAVTKVAAGGMPVVYDTIGIVVPFVGTTWNPADKTAGMTLTNNNLTTSSSISNSGVRSIKGVSAGKYYVEFTATWLSGSTSVGVGIASTLFSAVPTNQCSVLLTGNINLNGSNTGKTLGALGAGAVIGMALDASGKLIWFRKGAAGLWLGSAGADPAAGIGGQDISAIAAGALFCWISQGSSTGEVTVANFGASAFVGAVPSGYTAGWPA